MICGPFSDNIARRLELVDVDAGAYVKVLHLWCGKEDLEVEQLDDAMLLASVADRLEMTDVSEALEDLIVQRLRVGECGHVLVESGRLGLFRIEAAATKLAREHFEKVAETEGFMAVDEEAVGCMLDDDELDVSSEEAAFEGLVKWMKGGGDGLRGRGLLRKIRFGLMDPDYLAAEVKGMLPAEHSDWIEGLVLEALRLRSEGRGRELTEAKQLGAKAFTPRSCGSIQWERFTGGGGRRLQGFTGDVLALAECQDRVCGGSYDGSIRVWSRATLNVERTLHDDKSDAVHSLAAWGGRLISGHEDRSIRVWDVVTGACEQALRGHTGPVYALAVVGLRLASGSSDRAVRVWAMGPGPAAWPCEATLAGHGGAVNALAAWGGWLASGGDDARIVVWDAGTGAREATLAGHEDKVLGLAAHGDRLYSASKDGTVREWAAGAWEALRTVEACGRAAARVPCCLAVSGAVLVCGSVGRGVADSAEAYEVRTWDLDTLAGGHALAQPLGAEVWCVVAVGAEVWGGVGAEVVVWRRP